MRHYDPVIPVIKLDVDKMKQVFVNLLVNAYDAIESSGVIDISTHNLRDGIMIVFSDTGRGIPEGIRNRIFEPFFTTKEPGQGTGLGLAVSYGIIKEHSGEISVESEEGNGTTFKIWLPLKMNGVGD